MATFAEIFQQVTTLKQRREIFLNMLEHIDTSFLPSEEGKEAAYRLVTPDQVRVPDAAFEQVSTEITSIIQQIDQQIAAIEAAQVTAAAPPAAEPQESASGSNE